MKPTNVEGVGSHAQAIIRGWVDQGITFRDGSNTGFDIRDLTVVGGTLTVAGDGTAVLTIGGSPGTAIIYPSFPVTDYGAVGDGVTNDTSSVQDALDAAHLTGGIVYFPAGTYLVDALVGYSNVSIIGEGRKNSTLKARGSENIITITGTALGGGSIGEVETAQLIADLAFDGNGHSPTDGVAFIGVAYFSILRCSFTDLTVGVEDYGSLQSDFHDVKFVDNVTGVKYTAQTIGYYGGPVPPNRVLVSWCAFYGNTSHAIDYSGGSQLIIDNSEFGGNGTAANASTSAVWFHAGLYGNPVVQGLVMRGCWMEGSLGYAGVRIDSSVNAYAHAIADTYFPTNDATYAIAVDGGSGANNVTIERVYIAASASTRGIYRTANTFLDIRDSTGVLAGSGGVVRQDPLLDQTNVIDLSQMLALSLPSATSPGQTADGYAIWDSDDNVLTIGDGASRKTFGYLGSTTPSPDGTAAAGSALETSRADHVHAGADVAGLHAHVVGEMHLSDGSTTTYTLDNYFELGSVEAFNTTTLAYLVVTETEPDQATVSAAGSSGDKITFSYAATVA